MFHRGAYAFVQLKRTAAQISEKCDLITSKVYIGDIREHVLKAKAIHTALELISNTPNASVSRSALEAWGKQIDEAKEAIQKWAKGLFTPEGESTRESDFPSDEEIPY
jgi:chaperonin GroEL (HSP60 family)